MIYLRRITLVDMSESGDKYSNWRTTSSYISTAISIAMVIYVVGLLGMFLIKGKALGDSFKEKFAFEIYLKDSARDIEITQLKKRLKAENFIRKVSFKDKENALKEYQAEIDPKEDFTMTLGINPLPQNIDVYFEAQYLHPDSIDMLAKELHAESIVKELHYPKDLMYKVYSNVKNISLALLAVGGLLLVIAIGLITNTIRLRVYAQRFIIKTMQLVGASNWFIRKPFLASSLVLGFFSGILAVFALAGTLKVIYDFWPEFQSDLENVKFDLLLYSAMIIISIAITWFATQVAVGKFLRLKTDKLYY